MQSALTATALQRFLPAPPGVPIGDRCRGCRKCRERRIKGSTYGACCQRAARCPAAPATTGSRSWSSGRGARAATAAGLEALEAHDGRRAAQRREERGRDQGCGTIRSCCPAGRDRPAGGNHQVQTNSDSQILHRNAAHHGFPDKLCATLLSISQVEVIRHVVVRLTVVGVAGRALRCRTLRLR